MTDYLRDNDLLTLSVALCNSFGLEGAAALTFIAQEMRDNKTTSSDSFYRESRWWCSFGQFARNMSRVSVSRIQDDSILELLIGLGIVIDRKFDNEPETWYSIDDDTLAYYMGNHEED